MKVVHLLGDTMYEVGKAYGTILKEEMKEYLEEIWDYFISQIEDRVNKQPVLKYLANIPILEKWIVNKVEIAALDLTFMATQLYIIIEYYDELRGIADGSGINYYYLRRFQLIGELTKGQCSIFGSWGKASKDNKTIQLRSLDWNFDGPF